MMAQNKKEMESASRRHDGQVHGKLPSPSDVAQATNVGDPTLAESEND